MDPLPQPSARAEFPSAFPPDSPSVFPFAAGDGEVAIGLVLHRDAPDAGTHIDLFVGPPASPSPDARVARAFRLPLAACAAGTPCAGSFDSVELEPHRAEYLSLHGPRDLSGGRGRVEPILATLGRAQIRAHGFELRWDGWTARGERIAATRWRIDLMQERT